MISKAEIEKQISTRTNSNERYYNKWKPLTPRALYYFSFYSVGYKATVLQVIVENLTVFFVLFFLLLYSNVL